MHITIVAFGTWGDVRPYCVLGQALQANGHAVQIMAGHVFEEWISTRGLDYFPLTTDIQAILDNLLKDSLGIFDTIKFSRDVLSPAMHDLAVDTLTATDHSDAIMMMESGISVTSAAIEKHVLKVIIANMQLLTRTAHFPNAGFPSPPHWLPLRGTLNHLSHTMVQLGAWSMYGARGNEVREEQGMQKAKWRDLQHWLKTTPTLTCVSPSVIPRPDDWLATQHMTGFIFDDDTQWQPPQALQEFLEAGEAPIYLGFGSMSATNPEETTKLLIKAVQNAGKRAVILSGWAGLGKINIPEEIFVLKYAPHGWLFPQMQAVVHHGGAGTTAAGLRAGIPSIIVPHGADQPFWAQRVYQLGAGIHPIPRKKLTVQALTQAIITATTDISIQAKSQQIGVMIREEDGLAQAIKWIEYYLEQ